MTELPKNKHITAEVFHRLGVQEKIDEVYKVLSSLVEAQKENDHVFISLDKKNVEKLDVLKKTYKVSSHYEAIERAISNTITGNNRNLVNISIGPRGFQVSPIKK
ncbi:MAG: hypothetical protein WC408_05425 [Candidatus Micrarchaeia archaeon]|jgi:hypothetical protein